MGQGGCANGGGANGGGANWGGANGGGANGARGLCKRGVTPTHGGGGAGTWAETNSLQVLVGLFV